MIGNSSLLTQSILMICGFGDHLLKTSIGLFSVELANLIYVTKSLESIHPLGDGTAITPGGTSFSSLLFMFFLLKRNIGGINDPPAFIAHTTVVVSPLSALTMRSTCLQPFCARIRPGL